MTTGTPPMLPVPVFTYVPLRVAWEQTGGAVCALAVEVVCNRVRIAPSAAKPEAVRLVCSPKEMVISSSSYPDSGNEQRKVSLARKYFVVGSHRHDRRNSAGYQWAARRLEQWRRRCAEPVDVLRLPKAAAYRAA